MRGRWWIAAAFGLVAVAAVVVVLVLRQDGPVPDAAAPSSAPSSAAPPSPSAAPSRAVGAHGVLLDFSDGLTVARVAGGEQTAVREERSTGGEVRLVPRDGGWAVHFPARCQEADPKQCPRAILESSAGASLNPGTGRLHWGAAVLMTAEETSDGSNVVQKGYSQTGSQFKLQVDGAKGLPSCVVAGPVAGVNGIHVVKAKRTVADGQWHRIACVREGDRLRIEVDGAAEAEITIPAELDITNDAPLRIGGKGVAVNNDQFHGTLDDVFVDIG
ncbi:hypothetical protein CS0771_12170 [Catellatospora sp. IY07-71]|uniref:laminin G domain-containing protein n=1 Tax=Catellatospora sp. IY07-71 TaxID=2728827 RepID=UPI001BB40460|nr:laminin G domain-containing protein [Catellatospora sp. IY07-71]BCJ71673.1 hypothetical protein CS0771_12170 [Catellatospora sp. IY07-71]